MVPKPPKPDVAPVVGAAAPNENEEAGLLAAAPKPPVAAPKPPVAAPVLPKPPNPPVAGVAAGF